METATKPATILVVEDQLLINWDVADALRDDGYRALQAYTGEEAMTLLEAHHDIRVVFTDISLPGRIDGIALASEVNRRWPQIELLLTSAHRGIDTDSLDFVARYGRFVPKPYPTRAVTRRIREIIEARAA